MLVYKSGHGQVKRNDGKVCVSFVSSTENTGGGKAAKSKKGGLKSPNSSSERGGTEHSVPEGE